MAEGFLDIIGRTLGDGDYDGDQYGGADGQAGAGLPEGGPGEFMFATGIECSNPTIEQGRTRRDLLEECGHYTHWKTDLALVKALGLKVLRYGLPYYKTHLGPGRYDFSFADEAMGEIRRLGITPILDLMHFGVPDWLGNFQNPDLPIHFAAYAEEVAKRYPWVGADAILVSNHGGRQLDSAPSTISVLPDIARAVGDQVEVFFDGGIRTGFDVVKAMGRGAHACFSGRAWTYGLAAKGGPGVETAMSLIRQELLDCMSLSGVTDLRAIPEGLVAPQHAL